MMQNMPPSMSRIGSYFDSLRNQAPLPPALTRMRQLDAQMGEPSQASRAIHIAGTNGKGSVATKVARGLQLSGHCVGLYTSPHLHAFNERIQVNGVPICDAALAAWIARIEKLTTPMTFFEAVTLIAFCHFADVGVDWMVIEVGLGGRHDPTNIVTPEVAVITQVGLDHCEVLGGTVEAIAMEKAGIIKNGTPVVIGPDLPKAPIRAVAAAHNAPLNEVEGSFPTFDAANSGVAARVLTLLKCAPLTIAEAIRVRPPCRLEERCIKGVKLILDVAHNAIALEALLKEVTENPLHVVCGFNCDKDYKQCLALIEQRAKQCYLTAATTTRAVKIADLVAVSDRSDPYSSPQEAIDAAIANAQRQGGVVIVCGAFSLVAEALLLL